MSDLNNIIEKIAKALGVGLTRLVEAQNFAPLQGGRDKERRLMGVVVKTVNMQQF